MANYTIGVDLGGTNLRVAAVDEQGGLLEKITLGTRVNLGRDRVIHDMCESIQQLAQKYASSAKLMGMGIGVPGIIDMETGMIRDSANLPGWGNYPVRAEIEQRLRTKVFLDNDGSMAALGEKWQGAARLVDDMAMLTLGTGVGGGLVIGGKIWQGMNGMAGEFGHFMVEPEGNQCGCGSQGCLEQYASASAVVRMAREAIAGGGAPGLAKLAGSDAEFTSEMVYNLALQGDGDAQRIFRQVGRALGIVLGNLVNGLNLPMYVIGGGASSAWDAFAPAMYEEMRARSTVYAATGPAVPMEGSRGAWAKVIPATGGLRTIVTRALLGSDAGLYGAARLPWVLAEVRG